MLHFWTFFLRKQQFSLLLMCALVLLGVMSIVQIPKESSPEIEMPIAVVVTTLPGATALDMEELVTNKLEKPLKNNLEHIKKITSNSKSNVSSITVEFSADADIDESIDNLKDEVDAYKSELPTDASEPKIIQIDFAKEPVITLSVAADVPAGVLLHLAKQLEDDIENINGISDAAIGGLQDREVHVLVKRDALSRYNLTIGDIGRAIQSQNITLPSGTLSIDGDEYPVRFDGSISDTTAVARLPILAPGGIPITVGDVATVLDGFSEADSLSRLSASGEPSRPSFTVDIFKKKSAKITIVGTSVHERIAFLQEPGNMLDGITVSTTFDRADLLATDLKTLSTSGMVTVLLVMLVLFFAIGPREALVAGFAIPLSFLTAFIGLTMSGSSLNFISLFALILSTGIIVDSSIVIVEGINVHMQGAATLSGRIKAARIAVSEYHHPLTSGTLTTIAMFAPLLNISGVTGQFIAGIPYTMIFVFLSALFVTLAIIPILAVLVLKPGTHLSTLAKARQKYLDTIHTYYKNWMTEFMSDTRNNTALISVIGLFFIIALTLPAVGAVRTIFFPGDNSIYVFVEAELGSGAVLENTDKAMRTIEEAVYGVPGVTSFSTIVGKSSAFSNVFEGIRTDEKFGNIMMNVDIKGGARSDEIVADLRERLDSINSFDILVGQMEEGPPTGSPITITFSGSNLQDLDIIADQAAELLTTIAGTSDVSASTKNNTVEFLLTLDKAKALRSGVTSLAVAQTVNAALGGNEVGTINLFGEDIPVRVRMDLSDGKLLETSNNANIDALRYLPVASLQAGSVQSPSQVLLGSLITVEPKESRGVIRHDDAQRIAIVSSKLTDGANAREVTKIFKERFATELSLPSNTIMKIGGENEEVDQSFADMFMALIIGLTVMFSILIIQFNSIKHSLYILLTVPLSLIGVFAGLLIMDKPLSFPAIMGFVALSGIVVNNGIILIDAINRKRKALTAAAQSVSLDFATGTGTVAAGVQSESKEQEILREAVITAATSRLRPVVLTAITTIIGIIPLVFVAELWAPLAYAIIFGLTFATVITLILIPAIYYRWPGTQKIE